MKRNPVMFSLLRLGVVAAMASTFLRAADAAPAETIKVRFARDEDPIVAQLAESLGYFRQEGIEIVPVKVEDFQKEDYLLQEPLVKGQVDAVYHWFNHTVFGARHNLPIRAVMVFNDAPGMTVMVANRVKDQIRSAADFKGRRVAEGAGYGTKSVLTHYLARKAGLPPHAFTPVFMQTEGRLEAVVQGLKDAQVDVMTFQEPITSSLLATGMVTTLYDLNTKESTAKVLGAAWPAQSLLMSPAFIAAHPDTVQRLVNAFVRTMRYIHSHTPDEVIAQLPPKYFEGKDREAEVNLLKRTMPTLAKADYSFSPESVRLVISTMEGFDFDQSEEGQWRAGGDHPIGDPSLLYTNEFVNRAMREIP
ncbi:MAG: hypothetical protein JWM35_1335 [Verrucomicrobia bacterium]|nr:hypothetical protein [Verrucomicrobiota bacterium]